MSVDNSLIDGFQTSEYYRSIDAVASQTACLFLYSREQKLYAIYSTLFLKFNWNVKSMKTQDISAQKFHAMFYVSILSIARLIVDRNQN